MAASVSWRLMFRANDRRAFGGCLARALPVLGSGVVVSEGRPYWKIPELWECTVQGPVLVGSAAEQVLGCLLVARRLASGWFVSGPLSADSALGFSGVFNTERSGSTSYALGLEWASFDIVESTPAEPRAAPDPAT